MKRCSKCGEEKPESAYYRDRGKLRAQCKDCHKARVYARRDADPEGFSEYMARWRENHREELARRQRIYRTENADKINAKMRADRAANPEHHRAGQRRRRAESDGRVAAVQMERYWRKRDEIIEQRREARNRNLEAYREAARAWRAANRELVAAHNREYAKAHPDILDAHRRKRRARLAEVEHQPYTRREIYERDGGICAGCGEHMTLDKSTVDHIVPIALKGPDIPANLQIMCSPCNRAKWVKLEGQIYLPV